MQKRTALIVLTALVLIIGLIFCKIALSSDTNDKSIVSEHFSSTQTHYPDLSIDQLTSEETVIPFVKENGKLPSYYITKKNARSQGWIASEGNLCDVLPGKAIGGDIFANREKRLPNQKGRVWYEADINYKCGRRNSNRLIFSNDGLIFVTYDHYQTYNKR